MKVYYKASPPIANLIAEHPILKPIVRADLLPVVALSAVVVNITPTAKVAIVALLVLISVVVGILVIRRRDRGPEHT